MHYYQYHSIAQFCFFPKNTYKLLLNYFDYNYSACCNCMASNCEDCNNSNWTISYTDNAVESTYNFIVHSRNVSMRNYGLYTMTACVFDVVAKHCGEPVWAEVIVHSTSHNTDHEDLKKEITYYYWVYGLLCMIIIVLIVYSCWWWYCKFKCFKRGERKTIDQKLASVSDDRMRQNKQSSAIDSSQIPSNNHTAVVTREISTKNGSSEPFNKQEPSAMDSCSDKQESQKEKTDESCNGKLYIYVCSYS